MAENRCRSSVDIIVWPRDSHVAAQMLCRFPMLCLLFCAAVGFGTLKNLVIGHSFPNSALPGLAHSLLPTIYCSENCTKWFTNNVLLSNKYNKLAGLPGFARDSHTTIMSICAFHFYIIYFHFFSADHGIPQTFDDILTI